ncbi:MAG TPA: Ig-like domain-containing protein [Opitutaceae bacterium]|nr:Ig-like domain-containing protein [Opitutaceae bacterium]
MRHAPTLNGSVDGSVQQLTAESVTLNGGGSISGELLVPGTPTVRLNGNPFFGGVIAGSGVATPAGYQVTLNGGAHLGHLHTRSDPTVMASVTTPPQPSGTRSVSLNSAGQGAGEFATVRNLTLNGNVGAVAVPPGTYGNFTANGNGSFVLGAAGTGVPSVYNFQSLTLNGSSTLQVLGPVVVTVNGGFTDNGGPLGAAAHPEWLRLRIAGGGLTLNGSASCYGFVEAPDGTLTLNGSALLAGGAVCDRLVVNGGAVLRLVAPATVNQPPKAVLAIAAEGSLFSTASTLVLSATATDPDGRVARVEFYCDSELLGTLVAPSAAPDTYVWSGPAPRTAGAHVLKARAYDSAGAFGESTPVPLSLVAALPYRASFEGTESYRAGELQGQQGWSVTQGGAEVTGAAAFDGARSLELKAGTTTAVVRQTFAVPSAPATTFVDFFARATAGVSPMDGCNFDVGGAGLAFVREGSGGRWQAWRGDGAGGGVWISAGDMIPLEANGRPTRWTRLTMRISYARQTWDLYVDGQLALFDLGLRYDRVPPPGLTEFSARGAAGQPSYFDFLYAGYDNPLFKDEDRDGMDDAWESRNGLDPGVDDRDRDHDGDGLSNLREYQAGTRADRVDTDGDGLPDGWEMRYRLNPTVAALPTDDTDHDGLTDLQEFAVGTDPTQADTDGDGLPDGWEVAHQLNPLVNDAAADPDGDGFSNLEEYTAGTDPRDFFNGVAPRVDALFSGEPGPRDELALSARKPDGTPWPNAPVVFEITAGSRRLSAAPEDHNYTTILEVRADAQGVARAYLEPTGP